MAGFIGKGDLYMDRGLTGAFIPIGNATKLEIDETEAEIKERVSKQIDTFGQALDRIAIPKPAKIKIDLDEVNAENLAIALRGIMEVVNVSAGSVTAEEITAKVGKYVPLAHDRIVNGTVVVKNESGDITYVEGEDFLVNYSMGMIMAVEDGQINDNQVLKVDYNYGSKSGYRIRGSKMAEIECALLLDGINVANNKKCKLDIYRARLIPANAVDFLTEDFVSLSLEGTLITPVNKTEPYTIEYLE